MLPPPSSSEAPGSCAWADVMALIAASLRKGSHNMSAATGSFTSPSRTITIHNDILHAMLLPSGAHV